MSTGPCASQGMKVQGSLRKVRKHKVASTSGYHVLKTQMVTDSANESARVGHDEGRERMRERASERGRQGV
eukprot:5637490-Pleurochrysis_carterae.AAC.1